MSNNGSVSKSGCAVTDVSGLKWAADGSPRTRSGSVRQSEHATGAGPAEYTAGRAACQFVRASFQVDGQAPYRPVESESKELEIECRQYVIETKIMTRGPCSTHTPLDVDSSNDVGLLLPMAIQPRERGGVRTLSLAARLFLDAGRSDLDLGRQRPMDGATGRNLQ